MSANASFIIHRFSEIDSTNVAARALAEKGAPELTVVIARRQTAGRGTGTRRWHSPDGGIYLTALLKPRLGRRPTDLGFVAGTAVASALKHLLPAGFIPSVKWPNDCLVDDKKVAGILSEALTSSGLCAVGIGLNVATPPSDLVAIERHHFPAASLLTLTGSGDIAAAERALLTALEETHATYRAEGFGAIQALWESHCAHIGKKLRFRPAGGASLEGTLVGIDESGAIVLSTAPGARRTFAAGEIECFLP